MRSCPVGGLIPPLSSQLKLKPNDAAPVNPTLGGNCPPPRPVHAVSTAARRPAATRKSERRREGCAPVLIDVLRLEKARNPCGAARSTFPVPIRTTANTHSYRSTTLSPHFCAGGFQKQEGNGRPE
jgi:hypothetical protein